MEIQGKPLRNSLGAPEWECSRAERAIPSGNYHSYRKLPLCYGLFAIYRAYLWAGSRRAVSSMTSPTIPRLSGLNLSSVSCGLCQKTLL